MKVFVAGATGAIGKPARPPAGRSGPRRDRHDQLVGQDRHGPVPGRPARRGLRARSRCGRPCRGPDRARGDRPSAHRPQGRAGPEGQRSPDCLTAQTNRLRTEGTDHLLAAGRAVGIRRFIAQSIVAIGTYAAPAVRSRPRTTRRTSICRPRAAPASTPSATSRRLWPASTGPTVSCRATGPSTDRAPASVPIPRRC